MISVADFMTKDLVTVRESDDLALAESLLRLGGIRHLPVVRDRKLVGILTQRDVLRSGQWGKPGARELAVSEVMTQDAHLRPPADGARAGGAAHAGAEVRLPPRVRGGRHARRASSPRPTSSASPRTWCATSTSSPTRCRGAGADAATALTA